MLDFSALLQGHYLDWLLAGFVLSLQLTALAALMALPLGIVIALARLSPLKALRGMGATFVEAVRNVPLLAHMLFWYFAAPELLPAAVRDWLHAGSMEFAAALAALVLYTAAYMAEDVRSGLRSVPPGQWLAARALGLRHAAVLRWIVLPQALRATVPPLISQTLNLWKNSSLATVVGAAELMTQAQRVEAASFRGFETFAVVTAAYLGVSLLITLLATLFERRHPVRVAAR